MILANPNTRHLLALNIAVYSPSDVPCQWELNFGNTSISSIYQQTDDQEVSHEIEERPEMGWLEAMSGNCVTQILDGMLRVDYLFVDQ